MFSGLNGLCDGSLLRCQNVDVVVR